MSATSLALEGVRLIGRRPVSTLIWSLLMGLWVGGFMAGLFFGITIIRDAADWTEGDFARPFGVFLAIWFGTMCVTLVLFSVLQCAIYRSVLDPRARAFAYLRFGPVEGGMLVLQLVFLVVMAILEFGGFAVVISVSYAPLLLWVKILIGTAVVATCLSAFCILGARLALAGPRLVSVGRLDLGGAWTLSRGHFWTLLGMAVLAMALSSVFSMIAQLILNIALAPLTPVLMTPHGLPRFDPSMLRALAPLLGLIVAMAGVTFALQFVVFLAPFAAAYRALSGADELKTSGPA